MVITKQSLYAEVCLSALALQQKSWDCDKFLRSLHGIKPLNVSFLWHSFGEEKSCLSRLLKKRSLSTIHIHLINTTCIRNKNCGDYELFHDYTPAKLHNAFRRGERKTLKKYRRFLERASMYIMPRVTSRTRCLISPMLEAQLHGLAARNVVQEARSFFPTCEIVWNPLSFERTGEEDFVEFHGTGKPRRSPCTWSNDGTDIAYIDMPSYLKLYRRCELACLWTKEMNCRKDGKFIDPRERQCENKFSKITSVIRNYQ